MGGRRPGRRTIKQRLITAAVALPLLILLLALAPAVLFVMFLALVVLLAQWEFNRMGLADQDPLARWFSALAGAILIPVVYVGQGPAVFVFLSLVFLLLATFYLFLPRTLSTLPQRLGWICLGLIYVALLLAHLVPLRLLDDGRQWIFLVLVVIMCCDTCAYVIGSRFGKTKLYPRISPNKSVEGALGGLGGSVIGAVLAKIIFFSALSLPVAVAIGLVLGVVGQVGDLFESMLKRACGVKDSGTLIPGHGGLLDRLDSLLFAFPVVYYIAYFIV